MGEVTYDELGVCDGTYEDTSHDERIGFRVVETNMGTLTVYTRDEPGAKGHKAGTTKMEYAEPLPRAMKLKAKYLNR